MPGRPRRRPRPPRRRRSAFAKFALAGKSFEPLVKSHLGIKTVAGVISFDAVAINLWSQMAKCAPDLKGFKITVLVM